MLNAHFCHQIPSIKLARNFLLVNLKQPLYAFLLNFVLFANCLQEQLLPPALNAALTCATPTTFKEGIYIENGGVLTRARDF